MAALIVSAFMCTMRFYLFVLLGLHFCIQCQAQGGKVALFSALPEGDQLEIKWLSVDCFSTQHAHELTFQRSSNALVSIVRLDGPHIGNVWITNRAELFVGITNRVPLGSLALTNSDLLGLDMLVDFYRQRKPRCSTVHDFVVVTQRRQGQIVASEDFYDGTGGAYTDRMKGLRDLPFLLDRLERQNAKTRR